MKPAAMELMRCVGSVVLAVTIWFSGCDPVVSVGGAVFPDWLVCAMAGSLLAAACHPLLRASRLERHLRPLPFFYGCLIMMFSLAAWVTFFNRV